MKTYIYRSLSVTIVVRANDEDHAFCLLSDRIRELEEMDVLVPSAGDFDLYSAF